MGIVIITAVESCDVEAQLHPAPFVQIPGGIAVDVDKTLVGVVPLLDTIPAIVHILIPHAEEVIVNILGARYLGAGLVVIEVGKNLAAGVDAPDAERDFAGGAGRNRVLNIVEGGLGCPALAAQSSAALVAGCSRVGEGIIDLEYFGHRLFGGQQGGRRDQQGQDHSPQRLYVQSVQLHHISLSLICRPARIQTAATWPWSYGAPP